MRVSQTGDVWWKSAVFYCADVETFQDSDGDGVGDLRGMTDRIEYLADLGITCLWLMPLYPTAGRDDGYDITDFFGVDPRLGTSGDFVELVRTARSARHPGGRRLRHEPHLRPAPVVQERPPQRRRPLPPTTTSGRPRSPRAGRRRSSSPTRRTASGSATTRPANGSSTTSTRRQPDLNVANPDVQEQIASTLGYWLALGVSGFRIDAVPFLFASDTYPGSEPNGFNPQALPEGRA